MSTAQPTTSGSRFATLLLVGAVCVVVGRITAPQPPPAAPIELTQPIRLRRLEPMNAESYSFEPYAIRHADGSTTPRRPAPAPELRWALTFTLADGKQVVIAAERVQHIAPESAKP